MGDSCQLLSVNVFILKYKKNNHLAFFWMQLNAPLLICFLYQANKKRDLRQHMKFHKLDGPEMKLFCEYCTYITDCESRLRRHILTHTKEKPFACGLCDYK